MSLSPAELPVPPGDFGLPVIGATLNFVRDRNYTVKKHEQYGSVFNTRLLGNPTIFVKDSAANQLVLGRENKYFQVTWPPSNRALLGSLSLALQTGDTHQNRRKLLAQAFRPRALSGDIDTVPAITAQYADR
ncbi:MAG: cytochrome P450 [Cyanobacteria bacterium P01_D01_bin.6]